MRKILLSVLSVAGLLAALLALTGGPASAETGIARVESTNARGGTYTLTWKAKSGCDSSADGSVSGVVPPGASTDSQLIFGAFTTNDDCQYDFTTTYVTGVNSGISVAAGTRCRTINQEINGLDGDPATAAVVVINTAEPADCVITAPVSFTVDGPEDADGVDNSYHRKAVRARTWEMTLTPTGKGIPDTEASNADECVELVDSDASVPEGGERPQGQFVIIREGLDKDGVATSCRYDLSVAIPDGFVEASTGSSVAKNAVYYGSPGQTLRLRVAQREVYVVQNVTGDAGGGKVAYSTQIACSDAANPPLALPPVVGATGTRGGIETVQDKTLVPLTTGRYDVSEGIAGSMTSTAAGTSGRRAVIAYAVAEDGNNCALSVSANEVPANCTVASASQTINLLTAQSRNIMEFSFRCTATTSTPTTPTTAATSDTPSPGATSPTGEPELSEVDESDSAPDMPSTSEPEMSPTPMTTTTMDATGPPVETPTG